VSEWKWLSRQAIEIIHREQLLEHGGLPGLKDENALEAALARPKHKAAYGEPQLFELAAAYVFGIARNHPFADGNKRTSFLSAYVFLRIHGYQIEAEQGQIIAFMQEVAAGNVDETGIAAFLKDFSVPK
jgi:death-on-curing protein